MEEQELYDKVCNPRLKRIEENGKSIEKDVKQVLKILIGDNDHPDRPGICERLRKIEGCYKKFRKVVCWAAAILGGVWLTANATTIFSFLARLIRINGKG